MIISFLSGVAAGIGIAFGTAIWLLSPNRTKNAANKI